MREKSTDLLCKRCVLFMHRTISLPPRRFCDPLAARGTRYLVVMLMTTTTIHRTPVFSLPPHVPCSVLPQLPRYRLAGQTGCSPHTRRAGWSGHAKKKIRVFLSALIDYHHPSGGFYLISWALFFTHGVAADPDGVRRVNYESRAPA